MSFPVVLDTCVLFPMYLRDTLLSLAAADLFNPLWSDDILAELETALIRHGRATPEQTDRLITQLRSYFPDSEVTGYEPHIDAMTCDKKDRHVLAVAVTVRAGILVTDNGSDFPKESTRLYEIEVLSANDFLLDVLDLAPATVIGVLERQSARYRREPRTLHGLLTVLDRAGVNPFADEVRRLTT